MLSKLRIYFVIAYYDIIRIFWLSISILYWQFPAFEGVAHKMKTVSPPDLSKKRYRKAFQRLSVERENFPIPPYQAIPVFLTT